MDPEWSSRKKKKKKEKNYIFSFLLVDFNGLDSRFVSQIFTIKKEIEILILDSKWRWKIIVTGSRP